MSDSSLNEKGTHTYEMSRAVMNFEKYNDQTLVRKKCRMYVSGWRNEGMMKREINYRNI